MANIFKKVIDRQMWVQTTPTATAHAAGVCYAADLRSDVSRNPFLYQMANATTLNRFNIVTKGWGLAANPTLAGTFGVGSAMVFAPSQAIKGTLAAGGTTSKVVLSTALPTAPGVNMLANRGGSGDYGFKIRIISKSSGKTEERWIVANTGTTTSTILLDKPLTFTPALNDLYEILAGRVFLLNAGTLAAGSWKSFEVSTNTLATLTQTNLPATVNTYTSLVALDEQYTPFDMTPGEGFVKGEFLYDSGSVSDRYALAATAATSTTITGQASGGDSTVVANEYRNFQIRIVQDTVNPTAVGQRGVIASHTAGTSAVYTMGAAWAVTPSSSAKFVIEYPNLILARTSGTTTVYAYNYNDTAYANGTTSVAAGAWSTTLFGVAPAANAASGEWMPSFGIRPDSDKNARHSFTYFWRGGTSALDVLDIAGGTAGAWTAAVAYDGTTNLTTGTSGAYAPFGNEGRFFYMNIYVASTISQIFRFDVQNRVLSPYTPTDWIQSGTAAVGNRMAVYAALDADETYDVVYLNAHLSAVAQELIALV